MSETTLDGDGNLRLPSEVLDALGWEPGQAVHVQVEGDQLLAQPAARSVSLKDEARQLASAMRDLTLGAAQKVVDTVSGAARAPSAVPAAPASPARPAFQGSSPQVPASAYVDPAATLIGDVSLGEDASIWPGAVLRGDVAGIRVGARTNVQDGAVLHTAPQQMCVLGAGVTVGHQATIHACTIGDDTLIGIHAVVLDGVRVGRRCLIAAGALVPPGTEIPDGKMVMGLPAKIVRDLTPQEIERLHWHADIYVSLKNEYLHPSVQPASTVAAPAPPKPEPPARGALPRYECRRAAGEITVDGALDDPGWVGIPAASPLVHAGGAGTPAEATEVRACWDDRFLYLSFACKDADVWGHFENRDDPLYDEEVVEVFLCPTGDLRHYFEIEVSPNNVVFDAKVFNPEGDRRTMLGDREWNAPGLRTAVRVSGRINDRSAPDIGWIAEASLPFADLGLPGPPAPGTVWRANFYRIERGAVTEFTAWSPTYREPADFHVPACFGELVFVDGPA